MLNYDSLYTTGEAKQVIELLEKNGLKRGDNELEIIMMCELPTNRSACR